MLHRMRHVEILGAVVLAGSFLVLLFRNWLELSFSNDVNVNEASHDGVCHQLPEPQLEVVLDWDSSRVLQGSPTERFRGMLSRQYLMLQRIQIHPRQPS